jgi:hypothetical protein
MVQYEFLLLSEKDVTYSTSIIGKMLSSIVLKSHYLSKKG